MNTVYQFKPQARLKGDPQKVGEAIEALVIEKGTVSPADIVLAAKAKRSVLHAFFEWEDGTAAERYREIQASHLIRSIVTVKSVGIDVKSPVRGFVSIRAAAEDATEDGAEEAGSYTTIANAIRVVRYREQILENALRDLDAYRLRYYLLSNLSGWSDSLARARAFLEKAIEQSQAPVLP